MILYNINFFNKSFKFSLTHIIRFNKCFDAFLRKIILHDDKIC